MINRFSINQKWATSLGEYLEIVFYSIFFYAPKYRVDGLRNQGGNRMYNYDAYFIQPIVPFEVKKLNF